VGPFLVKSQYEHIALGAVKIEGVFLLPKEISQQEDMAMTCLLPYPLFFLCFRRLAHDFDEKG
jgi:hypothetical protein